MSSFADQQRSLGEQLSGLVLADPPSSATKVVLDWARRQEPPITEPGKALDAYRAAARRDRAKASDMIRARVGTHDGVSDVLTVVNARGIPTALRVSALDQVADLLRPWHVAELARTCARQHPPVVLRARDLLVRLGTAEALYVLVRVLGRREDDAGRLAREAGVSLAPRVAAVGALRAGSLSDEPGGEDLLYAALALPAGETAAARDSDDIRAIIELVATEIDSELQDAGRTAAGLNDYQQVVRDDLHALVLAWRLAEGDALEMRALDTLLRTGDAESIERLVAHGTAGAATAATRRTLDRSRRRQDKFRDQALGALRGLAYRADLRDDHREDVLDVVAHEDDALRAAAIEALASDIHRLDGQQRRQLAAGYRALPDDGRAELAPQLGGLAAEIARVGDVPTVAAWIAGATPDDARERVAVAAERLPHTDLAEVEATALLAAAIQALQVVGDAKGDAERALAGAVTAAFASRPERPDALLRIDGVAGMLARSVRLPDLAALDRASQQAVLAALIRSGEDAWLRAALGSTAAPDVVQSLAGTLAGLAESVIPEWDQLAAGGPAEVRRRMLSARLVALRRVLRELDRGQQAQRQASVEALTQRSEAVLAALDEAEQAARGNPGLMEQLDVVRRTVSVVEAADPGAPAEDFTAWLNGPVAKAKGVQPADGRIVVAFPGPDVVALALEADQKAHGRTAVPPASRLAFRDALRTLVDGLVAGGYGPAGPHWDEWSRALRGRGDLARLVWSAWAGLVEDRVGELTRRLAEPSGAGDALPLDALLRRLEPEDIDRAVAELPVDAVNTASRVAGRVLQTATRARDNVRSQLARGEHEAMRRLAQQLSLPFRSIESTIFGYFRLRALLSAAGWRQIAPSLGDSLRRDELHPDKHDMRGDTDAQHFVVRTLGIEADGEYIERAIVEGVHERADEEGR